MAAEQRGCCDVCYCVCCYRTFPQRFCLEIMLVLNMATMFAQRVCPSMAIVHMTRWTPNGTIEIVCTKGVANLTAVDIDVEDEQFDWDESVQSYILLGFYVGYVIGNAFVGFVIDRFGGRRCLLVGSLTSSAMTLAAPPLAYNAHWALLVASRAIAGLGQAALTSCASILLSRWFIEEKRSGALAFILTTYTLGVIVGNILSGYLMQWTRAWCYVYYCFGALGVAWCVAFAFYCYSYPQAHPHITQRELAQLAAIPPPARMKIPLRRIFGDAAVWMFFLGFMGSDYTTYLIITNMPKYYASVLGLGTALTGTILIGPPICGVLGGAFFGLVSDAVLKRKRVRRVYFRLACSVVGLPVSAACMLIMTYVECDVAAASALVCAAMFLKSAFYAGAGAMAVDLSINYGGLLYGYGNVCGGLSGMAAPYVVGALAYDNTFAQWRLVQGVTVGVAVATLLPILCFSKADRKAWDYGPDEPSPPPDLAPAFRRVWSCYRPV